MIRQIRNFHSKMMISVVVAFLTCCGLLTLAAEEAPSEHAKVKAGEMIENWSSIAPETLRASENAPVIEQLKAIADKRPSSAAVVLLLRYGDEGSIQRMIAQLRLANPAKRNDAMNNLRLAANPEIFPLLEGDLNRQESAELVFVGDVGTLPLSQAAASIMRGTILGSPVFPPDVKKWAKSLPVVTGELTEGVRPWWKMNKGAIERGDYQAVVPGELVPSAAAPDVTATPQPATPIATPPQLVSSSPAKPVAQTSALPAARQPVWPFVVGILALIVIVAAVLKRRA